MTYKPTTRKPDPATLYRTAHRLDALKGFLCLIAIPISIAILLTLTAILIIASWRYTA